MRRPAITIEHLTDAAMASNLILAEWSVDAPQLWSVVLNSIPLVQGTVEYTLPNTVMLVLDCFVRTTVAGIQNDRVMYGVSRSEYASFPNKLAEGFPNSFWADRVEPIQLSVYQAPDGNGPYTLFYYCVQRDQDAELAAGGNLDIPYRSFPAFADALAARLALSYKPERYDMLNKVAETSYGRLRANENENVDFFISPGLSGYYR